MKTDVLLQRIRTELADLTETAGEEWFFVFRARQGIEVVLKTLGELRGRGEVLTQPLTCATAVTPILSAGHVPLFLDTSPDDLSLDTNNLQASAATRALIMQHSFGIECRMDKARTFAQKHNLLLIEDSAHRLGLLARKDQVPLADVSIHSFGVEKMLPTKFGGAVWVNPAMKDQELRQALIANLKALPIINRATAARAKRYRTCNRLLNHAPEPLAPTMRRFLMNTGLFEPAISPEELQGRRRSEPAQPNSWVLKEMQTGLMQYPDNLQQRTAVTQLYREGIVAPFVIPKQLRPDTPLVRFPVLCQSASDAATLFQTLRDRGHYSGKWYRPTLFPGIIFPELYNYDAELCPVAEDISRRIINLPTNILSEEAKEILDVMHG